MIKKYFKDRQRDINLIKKEFEKIQKKSIRSVTFKLDEGKDGLRKAKMSINLEFMYDEIQKIIPLMEKYDLRPSDIPFIKWLVDRPKTSDIIGVWHKHLMEKENE